MSFGLERHLKTFAGLAKSVKTKLLGSGMQKTKSAELLMTKLVESVKEMFEPSQLIQK